MEWLLFVHYRYLQSNKSLCSCILYDKLGPYNLPHVCVETLYIVNTNKWLYWIATLLCWQACFGFDYMTEICSNCYIFDVGEWTDTNINKVTLAGHYTFYWPAINDYYKFLTAKLFVLASLKLKFFSCMHISWNISGKIEIIATI